MPPPPYIPPTILLQMDNRMRAWYKQNMRVGLLYTCSLGGVRPDRPVALIQNRKRNGADFMEVIPMEHQLPAQREQVWLFLDLPPPPHRALLGGVPPIEELLAQRGQVW